MKLHSVVRKTAMWAALLGAIALLVATVRSTVRCSTWDLPGPSELQLDWGQLRFTWYAVRPDIRLADTQDFGLYLSFDWSSGPGYWYFAVPIWLPVLAATCASIVLWRGEAGRTRFGAWLFRPRPRARTAIKWGGAVVSVGLLTVWIGSVWYCARWDRTAAGYFIALRYGSVEICQELPAPWAEAAFYFQRDRSGISWDLYRGTSNGLPDVMIPLWPLCAGFSLVAGGAWLLDLRARRCARAHLCRKCKYDRTGLLPGAACPECGAPPG